MYLSGNQRNNKIRLPIARLEHLVIIHRKRIEAHSIQHCDMIQCSLTSKFWKLASRKKEVVEARFELRLPPRARRGRPQPASCTTATGMARSYRTKPWIRHIPLVFEQHHVAIKRERGPHRRGFSVSSTTTGSQDVAEAGEPSTTVGAAGGAPAASSHRIESPCSSPLVSLVTSTLQR